MSVHGLRLSEWLPFAVPVEADRVVHGLALDSRVVQAGDAFFALAGLHTHGERFIAQAVQQGAAVLLCESEVVGFSWREGVPCFAIPRLSVAVSELAGRFYGHPSRQQRVIGVTGTNGKTTTTHAIAHVVGVDAPAGLLGTLGYGVYGALRGGVHTTPNAIEIQAELAKLLAQGVGVTAMEVSSHALAQYRVADVQFDTAVFTNLTRDHLDYHGSMEEYGNAKLRLFRLPCLQRAVVNLDDAFAGRVLGVLPSHLQVLTYTLDAEKAGMATVYVKILSTHSNGYELAIDTPDERIVMFSRLLGYFNVSNVAAAFATLWGLGLSGARIVAGLADFRGVAGRMESFGNAPQVVVDYAHTPDALQKVLQAVRAHCQGKLWCVFGCGGNRDRGKRPLMGAVAQTYADCVVLTDDNPRHESSEAILLDISAGCQNPVAIIAERREAIRYALNHAAAADIIVVAGKGHEDYQEVGDVRLAYSDRAWVRELVG